MINKYQTLNKSNTSNTPISNHKLDIQPANNSQVVTYKTPAAIVNQNNKKPYFIEYTSKNNNTKLISVNSKPVDPLEPTKFKHRKMQKESEEEQMPILRSPPKKLTSEDYKKFKIPPCISNYTNQKGYTLPLHMRVLADMRNNKEVSINDKFASFSDVLNLVEKESRKEIEERAKAKEAVKLMNNIKQEQELLRAAEEIRRHKIELSTQISDSKSLNDVKSIKTENTEGTKIKSSFLSKKHCNDNDINERNELRDLLKKEIKREQGNKNNKAFKGRDISEKISLHQAQPTQKEFLVDSRLYNQTSGVDTGFRDDEEYDLYDKPLFQDRSKNGIFQKGFGSIDDDSKEDEEYKKLLDKMKNRNETFKGAFQQNNINRKVDFEK